MFFLKFGQKIPPIVLEVILQIEGARLFILIISNTEPIFKTIEYIDNFL